MKLKGLNQNKMVAVPKIVIQIYTLSHCVYNKIKLRKKTFANAPKQNVFRNRPKTKSP